MASASSPGIALASTARARPIQQNASTDFLSSIKVAADPDDKFFSLLSPRRPRLHTIKDRSLVYWEDFLEDPVRSRTRRSDFKVIHPSSDTLKGQFRFEHSPGAIFRDITLEPTPVSSGPWGDV